MKDLLGYAGTLHEIAHARSGTSDISEQFELELKALLGTISKKIYPRNKSV